MKIDKKTAKVFTSKLLQNRNANLPRCLDFIFK